VHNETVLRAVIAALVLATLSALPAAAAPTDGPGAAQVGPAPPAIAWRQSTPVGLWDAGRLRAGVQLPAEGPDWFTWDPPLKVKPNRGWRRWGTDRLVRTVIDVLAAYRAAHPGVARVGVGDLSRRHGGDFGRRFGGLGHASHQNGLDADVYYPRTDGLELRAYKPSLVDRTLAQDLVDRFLAAGARVIYVGPHLALKGPRKRVVPLIYHDDHLHVRLQLTAG
jgi:murein endopeptidase